LYRAVILDAEDTLLRRFLSALWTEFVHAADFEPVFEPLFSFAYCSLLNRKWKTGITHIQLVQGSILETLKFSMTTAITRPTASLDATRRVPQRCADLAISQEFLANYVGWSKSEFSKRLRNGLTGPETLELDAALREIAEMLTYFVPLRPSTKPEDARRVRNFVRAWKEARESYKELSQESIREMWKMAAA